MLYLNVHWPSVGVKQSYKTSLNASPIDWSPGIKVVGDRERYLVQPNDSSGPRVVK